MKKTINLEKFLDINFPNHIIIDLDDKFISIEISHNIDKDLFDSYFENVVFTNLNYDEIEVVTPYGNRYTKFISENA